MSRRVAPAAGAGALIIVAALLLSSAGPSGAAPSCAPPGSHVLAASPKARIYSKQGAVYGCTASGGRRKLGVDTICIGRDRVGPVRLVSVIAAYSLERCGVDSGYTNVIVLRLSDGKQLSNDAATTNPLFPESYQSVDSLVLKPDGAVAWIAEASSVTGHGGRDIEVQRRDRHGQRQLDTGSTIKTNSLRLHGSTLTWKHAHKTRSASLS